MKTKPHGMLCEDLPLVSHKKPCQIDVDEKTLKSRKKY